MIFKPKTILAGLAFVFVASGGWRFYKTINQKADSTQEIKTPFTPPYPVALIGPFSNWLILKNLHKK